MGATVIELSSLLSRFKVGRGSMEDAREDMLRVNSGGLADVGVDVLRILCFISFQQVILALAPRM